jgi:fibronectin type 3 domain-containing protein
MSAIASASTLPLPNTPTNLAAAPTSGTRISLSWTDSVPPNGLPIGSYQVYCGQAPGGLTKVAATLNSSYTYNNLAAGTTYYCAVLAADTAGDLSAMSAPVSAVTYATPNAPTAVVATANSSTKVTVNWTETVVANGLPIASYQIYRGISPNNLSQVAVRATASYVDYSVSPLATYYYAVQATDTGNDASPISANTQVAVP